MDCTLFTNNAARRCTFGFIFILCFLILFVLLTVLVLIGKEYRFIFPYFRKTVYTLDQYYTNKIGKDELLFKIQCLCNKYGKSKVFGVIKYSLDYMEDSNSNVEELEAQRLEIIRDMKLIFKIA
jgi:hypothetical protein